MFAIQNYGLLWERKYIQYGWPGKTGHLCGSRRGMERVDFREQSGVYVLYDKDMKPIYIGQAGRGNANLFNRLKQHESDHLWNRWSYFGWFGLCKVNKTNFTLSQADNPERTISGIMIEALNDIEGVLIVILEPKLNKQGPKWKGVQEFFQYVDEEDEEITMDDLHEKIQEIEDQIHKLNKKIDKMS